MSHILFTNAMLCNSQVWSWLEEVDRAEAARHHVALVPGRR